ncbi:MAG TPA: alpha/beta family hydrolase [Jiangellaceae bacterium]
MRTEYVATPAGDARLLIHEASGQPHATLVLGHGASGGSGARDLMALASALPAIGVTVVRFEQPFVVAGRKVGPRPQTLDEAWLAAMPQVPVAGTLFIGGRSAGARVACRTAGAVGAAGVVALAFPLHPPGKPEKSRFAELAGAGVPTLVVQGENDTFGRPGEFRPGSFQLVAAPHANHSMAVPKAHDQRGTLETVVAAVRDFLTAHTPAGMERASGDVPLT